MISNPKQRSANVNDDVDGTSRKPKTNQEEEFEPRKGIRDSIVIKWLDKYVDAIDKYWPYLPNFVGSAAATCAIFLLGASFRGEWMLIFVHFARRFGYTSERETNTIDHGNDDNTTHSISSWHWEYLFSNDVQPYVTNFCLSWLISSTVAFLVYFGVGGFLQWYFYIRQRDKAEQWKIQPYKWLSPALEKHELILGVSSLFCTNTVTACFITYLIHNGPSMVYYAYDEYTWFWWCLQWPILYIILDLETYWFHRLYHLPTLYKMFHKLHHTYKQPTAWSVTAIHPFEIVHMQLCFIAVTFVIPVHLIPYTTIMIYNFYHGILDHSGINFKAQWWQPWQPDASFHDNHHQYTHVNFGFNMFYWDTLFGTYRQKDRIYNEDIFFGKGKKLSEATKEELEADLTERSLEHMDNRLVYKLGEEEIKLIKHN